ncbi:MAG: rod-binding protein [Acetobacteraceae bacterium]|nr:rod-binding protein [Acetobacteraceae bacterium]
MLPAPALPSAGGAATPARLREAALAFEAQVLAQLLQPAFATTDASRSAFGGGAAERQWQPVLTEALAASAARSGRGLGLADMVLRQALRLQESQQQENRP